MSKNNKSPIWEQTKYNKRARYYKDLAFAASDTQAYLKVVNTSQIFLNYNFFTLKYIDINHYQRK